MRAAFSSSTSRSTTPGTHHEGSTPKPAKTLPLYETETRRPSSASSSPSLGARPTGSGAAVAGPLGIAVHDLFPPAVYSRNAFSDDDAQNDLQFSDRPREPTLQEPSSRHALQLGTLNMSSASDSGKPPGSSRGRSYSNASRRGSSSRQTPSQAFQAHYPSLPEPPVQQSSYHGQYQSASTTPYPQHATYGSGQYTISPPLPPVSMVGQPSAPQYSYPSHPSLVATDPGMQPQNILSYSPNTLMQPHTPVYTYPSQPDAASSSSQPYVSSATTAPGLYSSAPSSHPLLTTPSSSQPSYTTATPYAARYPSPTFAYPPHSFGHTGNTLYQSQFSYGQQYRPPIPAEQEQGTWWYLPPGTRPAPSPHYLVYDNPYPAIPMYNAAPLTTATHESESYNPPRSAPPANASSLYPMSPRHQPPQPSFATTSPLQPLSQRPPGPDPPPPLSDPSPRPISEPTHSQAPSSPATMNRTDRQYARKPYHPNPPAHRSEWVMWAGNVPSDATHDELWRFFNRSPSPVSSSSRSNASDAASLGSIYGGVSSIHLISRSNCAFVNFESEDHLKAAIAHFNGLSLRPGDPKCPRLVCRVRAREDDLRAGVGGQRGAGMHVRHVREQKQKQRVARAAATTSPEVSSSEPPSSSPEDPAKMMGGLSLSSDEEGLQARRFRKPAPHSNSSGSYASTNSSLLSQYFPKRYFILKSLTQYDLDLSVEKGLWATQRHNEGILDQAYRTSKEVYLIFGVNKSGEFYGYARMAGPILRHHGEQREGQSVTWASRSSVDSPPRHTAASVTSPPVSRSYFSPADGDRYEESPLPIDESTEPPPPSLESQSRTAPAVMHARHRPLSRLSAGIRRHGELSYQEGAAAKAPAASGKSRTEGPAASAPAESQAEAEAPQAQDAAAAAEEPKKDEGPVWGESFQVEWLRTECLPFYRTRHLRNPWNHDREVKVSRDGTELEPSVGQALLDEWDKPDPQQTAGKPAPSAATPAPPPA